jgi:hypothetical protein
MPIYTYQSCVDASPLFLIDFAIDWLCTCSRPQSRARKRAASSASNAISRVSTADPALQVALPLSCSFAALRVIRHTVVLRKFTTHAVQEELERLEAEKFEFDRRERLHVSHACGREAGDHTVLASVDGHKIGIFHSLLVIWSSAGGIY